MIDPSRHAVLWLLIAFVFTTAATRTTTRYIRHKVDYLFYLTEAERAAAAEQGREQRRRFLTPGTGYQPGNARMFPNGN